jgi:hypothetical protein
VALLGDSIAVITRTDSSFILMMDGVGRYRISAREVGHVPLVVSDVQVNTNQMTELGEIEFELGAGRLSAYARLINVYNRRILRTFDVDT